MSSTDTPANDEPMGAIMAWQERPWGTPWAGRDDIIVDAHGIDGIAITYAGGLGNFYHSVALRRDGSAQLEKGAWSLPDVYSSRWVPAEFSTLALAAAFLVATSPPGPGTREQLLALLDSLSARERPILEFLWGLADGPSRTPAQIGAELGVTEERIRQVEEMARRRIWWRPTCTPDLGVILLGGSGTQAVRDDAGGLIAGLVDDIADELVWTPMAQREAGPSDGAAEPAVDRTGFRWR